MNELTLSMAGKSLLKQERCVSTSESIKMGALGGPLIDFLCHTFDKDSDGTTLHMSSTLNPLRSINSWVSSGNIWSSFHLARNSYAQTNVLMWAPCIGKLCRPERCSISKIVEAKRQSINIGIYYLRKYIFPGQKLEENVWPEVYEEHARGCFVVWKQFLLKAP